MLRGRLRLAASFISNNHGVACWHFAAFAAPQNLGRYRTNNGQKAPIGLNGSAANDPSATLESQENLGGQPCVKQKTNEIYPTIPN
jgi:hypothetical protein